MPKSKLRKNHKSKASAFKKRTEDAKRSFQKKMRALYDQQQQENLAKQTTGQVNSTELEGLNVDDFKLEEDKPSILDSFPIGTPYVYQDGTTKLGTSGPGIVEGVTTPPEKV